MLRYILSVPFQIGTYYLKKSQLFPHTKVLTIDLYFWWIFLTLFDPINDFLWKTGKGWLFRESPSKSSKLMFTWDPLKDEMVNSFATSSISLVIWLFPFPMILSLIWKYTKNQNVYSKVLCILYAVHICNVSTIFFWQSRFLVR